MIECKRCKVAKRKAQFPKVEGELAIGEICKKCAQAAKRMEIVRAPMVANACKKCLGYKDEISSLQNKVKELQAALVQKEQLVSRMGKMLARPSKRGIGRLTHAQGIRKMAKAPTQTSMKPLVKRDA